MLISNFCLEGTSKQIAEIVRGTQPDYPYWLLERLAPGEWYFIRCEEVVKLIIKEEK